MADDSGNDKEKGTVLAGGTAEGLLKNGELYLDDGEDGESAADRTEDTDNESSGDPAEDADEGTAAGDSEDADAPAAAPGRAKWSAGRIVFSAFAAVFAVFAVVYIAVGVFFGSHFYPETSINGINVSFCDEEGAQEKIRDDAEDYMLAVHDRNDVVMYVTADAIDYRYEPDGSVGALLDGQKPMQWPFNIFDSHDCTVEVHTSYDTEKLEEVVRAMDCFIEENIEAPTDAYIAYTEEDGYVIIPETQGNQPVEERVIADIMEAIENRMTLLRLDDDDYEKPAVTSDDEKLAEQMAVIEKYRSMSVTYIISGYDQVLDGETIMTWIEFGDDLSVTVDEDKAAAYAQSLASLYNTYADVRSFKTSAGDTIQIGGGDYGWVIDKAGEAEQLIEDIINGESVEREPVWEQRAFTEGTDDIGNTYIEIDYTGQHLYYYVDGELAVESDVVTGRLSNGNGSPDGVFKVISRKSPATLVGEDYESDVTYFLPFAYNVGMHDADWRSSFGGEIYKTNGSHGCVNMPYDKIEEIFEQVEIGTPVIAYYREDVTLTSESSRISNAYSYSEAE